MELANVHSQGQPNQLRPLPLPGALNSDRSPKRAPRRHRRLGLIQGCQSEFRDLYDCSRCSGNPGGRKFSTRR